MLARSQPSASVQLVITFPLVLSTLALVESSIQPLTLTSPFYSLESTGNLLKRPSCPSEKPSQCLMPTPEMSSMVKREPLVNDAVVPRLHLHTTPTPYLPSPFPSSLLHLPVLSSTLFLLLALVSLRVYPPTDLHEACPSAPHIAQHRPPDLRCHHSIRLQATDWPHPH